MPDTPDTLLTALLAVQKEIPSLTLGKDAKGQVAGNRSYKYLSLDKLMDEVLPLLNKHGLIWTTFPESDAESGHPVLRYALSHVTHGEHVRNAIGGTMPLMLDKDNSQGLGSAITYARRYALTAVLGIVPDEDDDGAKASRIKTPKPAEDRKLTEEELAKVVDATSGQPLELLLASVGADSLGSLTVLQGRDIMRKAKG